MNLVLPLEQSSIDTVWIGPVDVERQCGVILPNGQPCARSLTCKSHSMGAKRAVPGRSLPYDMLLAAYQKKNQAKQQSKLLSPAT
jgi:SAGA-associated factor 73